MSSDLTAHAFSSPRSSLSSRNSSLSDSPCLPSSSFSQLFGQFGPSSIAVHGRRISLRISPPVLVRCHRSSRHSSACKYPSISRVLVSIAKLIYSVGCFGLGFILDIKSLSQRRRAQLGLFTVVILNLGVYIWSIVMQVKFNVHTPGKIDWDDSLYATSFLPYFFVQTTGPLSQSYMYWLLSSFATDAQANVRNGAAFRCLEAVGQAISYGMNTQIKADPLIGL